MYDGSLARREDAMHTLVGVKLPFVNETELLRLGSTVGEAQPIGIRLPSTSSLYIDTKLIKGVGVDKTNLLITNQTQGNSYPGTLIEGASKITVTRFSPNFVSPNVNPRNQTLRLIYDANGSYVDVSVPTGWYLNPDDLMTALVVALNAVSGATGVTFSYQLSSSISIPGVPANSPQIYALLEAGPGQFFTFSPDSVGFQNGKSLWNSPAAPIGSTAPFTLYNAMVFGPIGLIYTRTVDVVSRELTKFGKRYDTTINPIVPPSLLCRVTLLGGDLISPNPYQIPIGEVVTSGFGDGLQLDAFSYDTSQVVTNIDVRILDQYGLPLYVPDPPPDGPQQSGFDYNLHVFIQ